MPATPPPAFNIASWLPVNRCFILLKAFSIILILHWILVSIFTLVSPGHAWSPSTGWDVRGHTDGVNLRSIPNNGPRPAGWIPCLPSVYSGHARMAFTSRLIRQMPHTRLGVNRILGWLTTSDCRSPMGLDLAVRSEATPEPRLVINAAGRVSTVTTILDYRRLIRFRLAFRRDWAGCHALTSLVYCDRILQYMSPSLIPGLQ